MRNITREKCESSPSSTSYRGRCAEHVNCINYSNVLQYSNVEPSSFFVTCIRNDAVTLPRVGSMSRAITSVELIKLQPRHFPASRKASFRSRASLVIIITIAAITVTTRRLSSVRPSSKRDRSETPIDFGSSLAHRATQKTHHQSSIVHQDRSLEMENKRCARTFDTES